MMNAAGIWRISLYMDSPSGVADGSSGIGSLEPLSRVQSIGISPFYPHEGPGQPNHPVRVDKAQTIDIIGLCVINHDATLH